MATMTYVPGPNQQITSIDAVFNYLSDATRFELFMVDDAGDALGSAWVYDAILRKGADGQFLLDDGAAFITSGPIAAIDLFMSGSGWSESARIMTLSFTALDVADFGPLDAQISQSSITAFGIAADFSAQSAPIFDFEFGMRILRGGDDVLTLTALDDVVSGDDGDDTLDGRGGDDRLDGNAGADTLIGGDGNDSLDGGGGADVLYGGAGDDTLAPSYENDVVYGGDGEDVVRIVSDRSRFSATRNEDGSITLADLSGEGETDVFHDVETFVFGADGGESETVSAAELAPPPNAAPSAPVFVQAASASERAGAGAVVGILAATDPDDDEITFYIADERFQIVGAEVLRGGAGELDFESAATVEIVVTAIDGVAETPATLTVAVTDAAEALRLTDGADIFVDRGVTETSIDGRGGDDRITGTINADRLLGGAGDDTVSGGAGADRLEGGGGADEMTGGAGDDVYLVDMSGDRAIETSATGGVDLVQTAVGLTLGRWIENGALTSGAAAGARLTGNGLDNALGGNARANALVGGDGDDALDGGDGDDALSGDAGADVLSGGAGADRLIGGAGSDRMTGGAGADDFVFTTARTGGTRDRDVIVDFTGRVDDIDVAAIDANVRRGGDQAFAYLGDDAFSGRGGELRYDGRLVLGDVDGDRRADLIIDVADGLALRASDFIL